MTNSLIPYRPLPLIARDIEANWDNPNTDAVPHIEAMKELYSLWADGAHSAVVNFVINSMNWEGEVADAIIQELLMQLDIFASGAKDCAEGARSLTAKYRKP
jgi:hypothetical protein